MKEGFDLIKWFDWLFLFAIILVVLILFGLLFSSARANSLNATKEVPVLDSCEQYLEWSEDMQRIYIRDLTRQRYAAAGNGFRRCLDRYADEAADYVLSLCNMGEHSIAEAIKKTDDVINIFCLEKGKKRQRRYLQKYNTAELLSFEIESCRAYKSLPGWFRRSMLRDRIVEDLTSKEAPLELIWCVKENYRLEKLEAKIIQRCDAGAELKLAAREEITAYVALCADTEKMRH